MPSWSWVAWKGYMGFGRPGTRPDTTKAHSLVEIRVRNGAQNQPSTINEYIQAIHSGGMFQQWLPYVELTGWVVTARLGAHIYGPQNLFLFEEHGGGCIGVAKLVLGMLAGNEAFGNLVSVLLVAHDTDNVFRGLILRRFDSHMYDGYERLGTCRIYHDGTLVREDPVGFLASHEKNNPECHDIHHS
jgi:hypothetical protein